MTSLLDDDERFFKLLRVAKVDYITLSNATYIDLEKFCVILHNGFSSEEIENILNDKEGILKINIKDKKKYVSKTNLRKFLKKHKEYFKKLLDISEELTPTESIQSMMEQTRMKPVELVNIFLPEYNNLYSYDDINTLNGQSVIYIGFIGKYGEDKIWKYGITDGITERIKDHIKTYGMFQLVYLKYCGNKKLTERTFGQELEQMGFKFEYKIL